MIKSSYIYQAISVFYLTALTQTVLPQPIQIASTILPPISGKLPPHNVVYARQIDSNPSSAYYFQQEQIYLYPHDFALQLKEMGFLSESEFNLAKESSQAVATVNVRQTTFYRPMFNPEIAPEPKQFPELKKGAFKQALSANSDCYVKSSFESDTAYQMGLQIENNQLFFKNSGGIAELLSNSLISILENAVVTQEELEKLKVKILTLSTFESKARLFVTFDDKNNPNANCFITIVDPQDEEQVRVIVIKLEQSAWEALNLPVVTVDKTPWNFLGKPAWSSTQIDTEQLQKLCEKLL